ALRGDDAGEVAALPFLGPALRGDPGVAVLPFPGRAVADAAGRGEGGHAAGAGARARARGRRPQPDGPAGAGCRGAGGALLQRGRELPRLSASLLVPVRTAPGRPPVGGGAAGV